MFDWHERKECDETFEMETIGEPSVKSEIIKVYIDMVRLESNIIEAINDGDRSETLTKILRNELCTIFNYATLDVEIEAELENEYQEFLLCGGSPKEKAQNALNFSRNVKKALRNHNILKI